MVSLAIFLFIRWIGIMPKVQTAIACGHQFVLTSRRHIYEAAKMKLGNPETICDSEVAKRLRTLEGLYAS